MRLCSHNLWMVLTLTAGLWALPATGQDIRLRPRAAVDAAAIRLGDVAELKGLAPALTRTIVAWSQSCGTDREITLADVQAALRREGVNTVPIRFSGAARCTVRRAADARVAGSRRPGAPASPHPLPASPAASGGTGQASGAGPAIGQQIRRQLLEQLASPPEALTLEFVPASRETAEHVPKRLLGITSTDRNTLGRRCWRVDYERDGRRLRRYLTASVRLSRPAVVTRRPLGAGAVVVAEDVKTVTREDDGREDRLTDLNVVVGQQVRRPLEAGQVVRVADLKAPILIARGQLAWVRAGPVRVRARAMSQGAAGETVEFENPQSKGRFWAQVTGPGLAQASPRPQS